MAELLFSSNTSPLDSEPPLGVFLGEHNGTRVVSYAIPVPPPSALSQMQGSETGVHQI